MIRLVVCDDEKEFRKKVVKTIDKLFMKNNIDYEVKEFSGYDQELEKTINQSLTSRIYILDIETNSDISGIDIARIIRKTDWNSIIIMVTSHSDSGLDALKAQIMLLAFISKYDEWEKNLTDVLKKAIVKINHKKVLLLESSSILHRIYLDDILYVTTDTVERKCIIKTTYAEIPIHRTMSQLIEELDNRFFLTHRSCLVNTDKITKINWKQNTIYFEQEKVNLLSRDKKKGLKELVGMV